MDIDSTAESIEKLFVNNELRIQMGENGFKLFKQHFTLDVFNKSITDIVKKMTI